MIAWATEKIMTRYIRSNFSPETIERLAGLINRRNGERPNGKLTGAIQSIRLRKTINYVYKHSPFYRSMFERLKIAPSSILTVEDLKRLPLTSPEDIKDLEKFLCVPHHRLSAVYTSSGTTGEPKRVYFTLRDLQILINVNAVLMRVGHRGRFVALIALPVCHGLWIASSIAHKMVERAGGLPLPVGADNPQDTLRWMRRFNPNVVISSPSIMTAVTREAEREGYRPRIDKLLLSGEMLSEAHKSYFSRYWGADVYNGYGSTEMGGAQTIAQPGCSGFHPNDLHLVTEIVDPQTGKPAEEGEIVFTTLSREAMPLLRYRSGDRGRWINCGCNLPLRTLKITGRTDDMIVAGDMNLFGPLIAKAISGVPGASGRVRIELHKHELKDKMVLYVEGGPLDTEDVFLALHCTYPEIETNVYNGNLSLEIKTGVDLGTQIKALSILDKRFVGT